MKSIKFSIDNLKLNQKRIIRFVEPEDNKPRTEWKLSPEWEWFIGKHRSSMTLPPNLNLTG